MTENFNSHLRVGKKPGSLPADLDPLRHFNVVCNGDDFVFLFKGFRSWLRYHDASNASAI